jgi:hypothetical protein
MGNQDPRHDRSSRSSTIQSRSQRLNWRLLLPRTCTVCRHPERAIIDGALVAAEPFRVVANRTGLSDTALFRHKTNHIPASLTSAGRAVEISRADDLLAQVHHLRERALALLDTAEAAGDLKIALQGIREARNCIELLARLEGELEDRTKVNIFVAPDWLELRAAIAAALRPFPEASDAVASALIRVEAHGDRT